MAEIEATNQASGVTSKVTANSDGQYFIRYLLPALYRVTAWSPGLKTLIREGIEIRINERVELNFALEIGTAREKITVVGESLLVETATAGVGQVIERRRIIRIAAVARQPHGDAGPQARYCPGPHQRPGHLERPSL